MSQNGKTLKAPYVARGLCIVTGETIPDVPQSRLARCLIINITKNSIALNKLTKIQNNGTKLSCAMKTYIGWVIKNEQKVSDFIKNRFYELRSKADKDVHGRTSEIAIVLTLGFELYTQCLKAYNIIDEAKKQELDNSCFSILTSLVEKQSIEITDLKPTEMFYNAIDELFSTNIIKVLSYRTGEIVDKFSNEGTMVGYYDDVENLFYFFPNALYNKVSLFYSQGGKKFPINAKSLWKYLLEEGQLYRTDNNRYTKQITVNGKKQSIVAIRPLDDPNLRKFDPNNIIWEKSDYKPLKTNTF